MDPFSFSGIVFDFDGLIVDTETPLYEAWAATFRHFGLEPIALDVWAHSLGRHDDDPEMLDPVAELQRRLGPDIDVTEAQKVRRERRDAMLAVANVRPGVRSLIAGCNTRGLPIAIASSSPADWVDPLLTQHRLIDSFSIRCHAGGETPGKPDPAVYLLACERLGIDPAQALALEDSPNGIRAAKAAGMTVVAAPTFVSRSLDLSLADSIVTDLTELLRQN